MARKVTVGPKAAVAEPAAVPPISPPSETRAVDTPPPQTTKGQSDQERWLADVLDKQYRLYAWADAKILNLITINGLLLAAIGFVFSKSVSDRLSILTSMGSTLSISISLFFCLVHSVPKLRSGKSKNKPPIFRSVTGINSFKTVDEYSDYFFAHDHNRNADAMVRQAYGMAVNNKKSELIARIAAFATFAGAMLFVASFFANVLYSRGYSTLGEWPQCKGERCVAVEQDAPGRSRKADPSARPPGIAHDKK